jgi:hypothetical protein
MELQLRGWVSKQGYPVSLENRKASDTTAKHCVTLGRVKGRWYFFVV